ncbi:MAG: RNA 2',3'-cyclic phosphodiesterase [Nitrososphaerales archaeon]
MRSFLALDVKSPEVLFKISEIQSKFLATNADLKPVSKENLHFTLKFFGEIDSNMVERIIEKLKTLNFRKFFVTYRGLGAFPNLKRINVIWIGVNEGAEKKLKEISDRINENLLEFGFSEDKPFTPHLTILRVKSGKNIYKLAELIQNYQAYEFGSEVMVSLTFKKSELTPRGPIYTNLAEFPFQGG